MGLGLRLAWKFGKRFSPHHALTRPSPSAGKADPSRSVSTPTSVPPEIRLGPSHSVSVCASSCYICLASLSPKDIAPKSATNSSYAGLLVDTCPISSVIDSRAYAHHLPSLSPSKAADCSTCALRPASSIRMESCALALCSLRVPPKSKWRGAAASMLSDIDIAGRGLQDLHLETKPQAEASAKEPAEAAQSDLKPHGRDHDQDRRFRLVS